jgi:hypothetical protein
MRMAAQTSLHFPKAPGRTGMKEEMEELYAEGKRPTVAPSPASTTREGVAKR